MMEKNMLFVFNPKSGKAKIKNKLLGIVEAFVGAGYEVTIRPTQYPGEAVELIKNKKNEYDIVACSGGDGTLDEVVHGMLQAEKKVPIGYIPAGSTNDFARTLGIPKDMEKAAKVVVEGKSFLCDIGLLDEKPFVYVAAFGLFTDVSYETNQDIKNLLGHTAYILEGMKKIPSMSLFHMKVSYEDVVIEDDFLVGLITNSTSVGGFKTLDAAHVELNDGLFEVTLVTMPKSPLDWNQMLAALVDRNIKSENIICFKASHVVFESEKPVAWTRDGEYGGDHVTAEIKNIPKALEIKVP